jgi:hypothetical protein
LGDWRIAFVAAALKGLKRLSLEDQLRMRDAIDRLMEGDIKKLPRTLHRRDAEAQRTQTESASLLCVLRASAVNNLAGLSSNLARGLDAGDLVQLSQVLIHRRGAENMPECFLSASAPLR